jgi:hypothetical protein
LGHGVVFLSSCFSEWVVLYAIAMEREKEKKIGVRLEFLTAVVAVQGAIEGCLDRSKNSVAGIASFLVGWAATAFDRE